MEQTRFPSHRAKCWLDDVMMAQPPGDDGIIRWPRTDLEDRIGRHALELEIRKRGYHMFATAANYIIICQRGPLDHIC